MARRTDPGSKSAWAFSVILHVSLFAVAWLSTLNTGPQIEFVAYEIDLVSPPPAAQAEEPQPAVEELVVERPEPEPEPIEPESDVVAIEEPEPEPEPEPTPPEPEPTPEPEPEPAPAASVEPPAETEPDRSGEGINVRMEGLRRDYPEYYNNIIRQIGRCFYSRWRQGGNWETVIAFTLGRDGVASDLEFLQRSGNVSFDFEAMGAIDCAGQGRFGPLPEDLPWNELRISFTFEPPRE